MKGGRFFGFKMVMNPRDAAHAAKELKSRIVIPIHFGTFGKIPFMFSMDGNPSDFINSIACEEIKNSIEVLDIGQCLNIP